MKFSWKASVELTVALGANQGYSTKEIAANNPLRGRGAELLHHYGLQGSPAALFGRGGRGKGSKSSLSGKFFGLMG